MGYKIFAIYLLIINVMTLFLYGYDKLQARKHRWRVSEKTLFISSLLGGSIGAVAGMRLWRHKTRKWYFRFGIPMILVVQLSGLGYLWLKR